MDKETLDREIKEINRLLGMVDHPTQKDPIYDGDSPIRTSTGLETKLKASKIISNRIKGYMVKIIHLLVLLK